MPRSERFCPDIVLVSTSGRIPQWLGIGENVTQSKASNTKIPGGCLGHWIHRPLHDGLLCPTWNKVHRVRSCTPDCGGDQQWKDYTYWIAAVAWIFDWTIGKEWLDACDYECERDT